MQAMMAAGRSNLGYRLELLVIRLRDLIRSPAEVLVAAGVRPGMTVLDFGCGPGGFSLAAARLVGPQGRVYALDIHPLALESVRRAAAKEGIGNIQVVPGEEVAGFAGESVEMVLLYDVLHDLPDPAMTLAELRRVLKPDGVLSVGDHHLNDARLLATVAGGGLFGLKGQTRWTHQFDRLNVEVGLGR